MAGVVQWHVKTHGPEGNMKYTRAPAGDLRPLYKTLARLSSLARFLPKFPIVPTLRLKPQPFFELVCQFWIPGGYHTY